MNAPYTLHVLWRAFHKYRIHVGALVVLGFLSALFEGIGINAAIPLLTFLIGGSSAPVDTISRALQAIFGFFSVDFTFRTLLLFILFLFIARAVSIVVFGYMRGRIQADFLNVESQALLRGTLRASWPFLLQQKIGTVQNSLVRDVQRTTGLLDSLSQVIQSFSGFLMSFVVALSISPTTTLFTFFGGGALLVIVRPLLRRIQRTAGEMALTEKHLGQSLSEQIAGMKSIKAAAAEEYVFAEASTFMNSLQRLQSRIALIKAGSTSLFQPFTLVFISIAFYVSYHSPSFSLVSFGATLYLIQKMFTYLESGQNGLHSISELVPYAQNIADFKHNITAHAEKVRGKIPFSFARELRFENVSFGYSAENQVLHDVSFTVTRGAMVALIGPSGVGKTSVADILLRLFQPSAGRLLVDQVPAEDISLDGWRRAFGYVAQDAFLFNGTLEDNIRFYRPDISESDIHTAARQAHLYEFITGLPRGFQTLVGDRGITLSGGQRQRVALARALAGNPALLVLDEATSSLDVESERLIQEAIRALHGSVTVFVIAHRLSTVEHADTILVLNHGHIEEKGTPQELLANTRSYFTKHYHMNDKKSK